MLHMYDADIVFLLLSSSRSTHFLDFLALHDAVANAGFHTVVATCPAQISQAAKRFRVVVIDGDSNGMFDPYAVTRAIRQIEDAALVLLTDAMSLGSDQGLNAGADVCLLRSACHNDILDVLTELVRD